MKYKKEEIDAMKKLMEAYNEMLQHAEFHDDFELSFILKGIVKPAIRTLSLAMKDSLDGLSA